MGAPLEGLRVVVDCAHGAAYKVAPTVLWELGAEVVSVGVAPDGFNINQNVGSTAPQQLATLVRERRADREPDHAAFGDDTLKPDWPQQAHERRVGVQPGDQVGDNPDRVRRP